ncbi:MAG: DUF4250 domain-containing protein [Muribaculaceae bacterium]|nr:DUF4250 domain-containing protein [Muribaculaceae bacterium]
MNLPKDPYMLLSVVNMKLRDEYPTLSDLCLSLGIDEDELKQKLSEAGYSYNPDTNSFI